ncbi:putative Oligopeptide transporter, partial [Operophtera brumata]
HAFTKRLKYNVKEGAPQSHWLDYSISKYGDKLVEDMKVVFSILYLYLPLQVMNPAIVLVLIPVCPGGSWSLLPVMEPLQKMFIGGVLAALAFLSAGILQIGIEAIPGHHQTGLVLLNTLACPVDTAVRGEGTAPVEGYGTALMTPLPHTALKITASCPIDCAGRVMKKHAVSADLNSVAGMFMPVVIGQNSDDQISLFYLDPSPFLKSLTGKPKLKSVKCLNVETEKKLSDIYYVSNEPVDHIGESAYMCLQPGNSDGEVSGSGEGYLRAGGVYVLCVRERLGRLDAAVLHAPNPPNELHLAWILPQYILVSIAEIMFAVSGLEFSFTQATEFFVYASALAVAMLVFLRMAQGYELRIHSLTNSTQGFSVPRPGSSAASCLSLMERARVSGWPTRANVHMGTPSTSECRVTTLAKD